MQRRTYPFASVILSPGSKIGHTPRKNPSAPMGAAATSRINAYRGLRSLLILHKPSAAKMYYTTSLPVIASVFWHFYKIFFEKFLRYAESSGGCMSFQQSAWFFGESSPVFQANCSVKSYCSVGAAHVRPACLKVNGHLREGRGPGRLSADNERRQPQKHCSGCLPPQRATFAPLVPLNRGPTLSPASARPLQLSWAAPAHPPASHSPLAPIAPSLQWRYRAQSSPPLPSL